MKKILSILPTQSLIYLLICGAGILVFVFLIIIPTQKTSAELDKEIVNISDRIEEQRILKPVFESLLKRAKKKNPTELPATKKAKLDRADISKLSEDLQEMALRQGLKIQDMNTDVSDLVGKSRYLRMRINLTGAFMDFRGFLVDLGTIPSLEVIEEIQIRAIEGSREFKIKIWMAQK
jgi:Tfp pilus assembly protein PilO